MKLKESEILLDHKICRNLIYLSKGFDLSFGVRSCFLPFWHLLGLGLVFCLSQKSHTNTLRFHGANEDNTDIYYLHYLQDDILRRSPVHL